ncbi:protein MIS12 homolog isoform X1 [Musa acuminata AAA Group]|uniref:protein MIS12 homolog isoform X1 n=1 Tax=Musa acuminata AAA Group TaxID=214697 RepID=UPI0031D5E8EF
MEGSESEAVFDAYNLNPQRFLNEVLNAVDDMVDGAFDFCLHQAPQITGPGADRSEELARGVSSLRHLTQAVLDKRMSMWEKYCLRHCFSIPDGFVLPKTKEYSISVLQEVLSDQELDSHLDSLREKLAAAGKESQVLHREINLLEMQSTADNKYNASVAEVQQLFKEHSVHLMFQELVESASKLHQKVAAELKSKRLGDMKQDGVCKKHCLSSGKQMVPDTGISSSLEDIQEIVSILKNT